MDETARAEEEEEEEEEEEPGSPVADLAVFSSSPRLLRRRPLFPESNPELLAYPLESLEQQLYHLLNRKYDVIGDVDVDATVDHPGYFFDKVCPDCPAISVTNDGNAMMGDGPDSIDGSAYGNIPMSGFGSRQQKRRDPVVQWSPVPEEEASPRDDGPSFHVPLGDQTATPNDAESDPTTPQVETTTRDNGGSAQYADTVGTGQCVKDPVGNQGDSTVGSDTSEAVGQARLSSEAGVAASRREPFDFSKAFDKLKEEMISLRRFDKQLLRQFLQLRLAIVRLRNEPSWVAPPSLGSLADGDDQYDDDGSDALYRQRTMSMLTPKNVYSPATNRRPRSREF